MKNGLHVVWSKSIWPTDHAALSFGQKSITFWITVDQMSVDQLFFDQSTRNREVAAVVQCFTFQFIFNFFHRRPMLYNFVAVIYGATTLSILTFSMTTLSIKRFFATLSIATLCHPAECRYAECYCNAECHYAMGRGAVSYTFVL